MKSIGWYIRSCWTEIKDTRATVGATVFDLSLVTLATLVVVLVLA